MVTKKSDPSRWAFLQAIIKGLEDKPAYTLIFGLSGLFFVFGLTAAVDAVVQKNTQLLGYAFAALLASLIAAVIVILKIEPDAERQPVVSEKPPIFASTGDARFDETLRAIHGSLTSAVEINNRTFRDAIQTKCDEFRARAKEWSVGEIGARSDYNHLLVQFYECAQHSVFSTSVPGYLEAWSSGLGQRILKAHGDSRAAVTRVFIFDRRDEVTPEAIAMMQDQAARGVRVKLHFSSESTYSIPADLSKDFTFIDNGEAIGVTISFGGEQLAATWYIQNKEKAKLFGQVSETFTRESVDLSRFLQAAN